ncbi:MAG: hypothetical protein DRP46_01995 [Candidatus Zixiibacteriota bacterium]|nr:MAG: hypothetical protein DRP46_01995 [candidate division Zixibacteria bacterium]
MAEKPIITFRIDDNFYDKLDAFTKKILHEGLELFSEEFKNIDAFYLKTLHDTSDRSDQTFRQTPKQLYLVEAIYYQVFEYINRDAFNKTKDTVLILPDCMSLMGDKCERKQKRLGKVCTRCAPNCSINKIMQVADKYGVDGYFSKRKLTEQIQRIKKEKQSLAVIGISCILTLASGMRSAKEAGVPSRGVYLNFTGCEHWADKPFTTETMIDRVEAILEEKYGLPHSAS